jgi:hypothetical protein
MPVRVLKDGQMVDRLGGYTGIGPTGKKTYSGYTTVESANAVLKDEDVADHLLELVKAGDHPGLAYISDEDSEDDDESSPDPELVGENERLKATVAQQEQKIEELESKLEEAENGRDELTASAVEAQSELAAANERIEELESAGPAEGSEPVTYTNIQGFDPNDYNQPQVLDYFANASPDEVARVQDVEKSGQNRQQIMGFKAAE